MNALSSGKGPLVRGVGSVIRNCDAVVLLPVPAYTGDLLVAPGAVSVGRDGAVQQLQENALEPHCTLHSPDRQEVQEFSMSFGTYYYEFWHILCGIIINNRVQLAHSQD